MEDAYIVRGGQPLKGEVQLSGAKNAALKIIIASLLFDGKTHLLNVPHIGDIADLLNLINALGGEARFVGRNEVVVDGHGLKKDIISLLQASKLRVSFMLFAPLLYRLGQAKIPNPGGCRIGSRPIDRQVHFMQASGIKVNYREEDGYYQAKMTKKPQGIRFRFDKPTHTGTEFAMMFSVLAEGESVIENVCLEPEIDDLISFLNAAGGQIVRLDDVLYVKGTPHLRGEIRYKIGSDRNEAVTFAVFALATKGDILVKPLDPSAVATFVAAVKTAGGTVEEKDRGLRFFYQNELRATDIVTGPHPGFMTDWQAPWAVLMTQAAGVAAIHETVFENRFCYVDELVKLGARIEYFQPEVADPARLYQFNWVESENHLPQAIKIFGKTNLHNGVLNVSDLRAGASLLVAAAACAGESVIRGASVIDRGYEAIDKKLRSVGGVIEKV